MKNFDICVIGGCGHVGLPLSLSFASKGKNVVIYDTNHESLHKICQGKMPFMEVGSQDILEQALAAGKLELTSDPANISYCDYVVITIGTPIDEHMNPQLNLVKESILELMPYFCEGQTVVLRSTVYPGTSKSIEELITKRYPNIYISYCPERVLEGKAIEELETLPQIVSAFNKEGLTRSIELFQLITDDIVILEPMEAELTKLFNNVWRYIKFAAANQFFMIANDLGLDFYKIYYAMTHNYSRAEDFPTPGFTAGPCLFKDSIQLSACNKNFSYLGHSAMFINEGLPGYIVEKLRMKYPIAQMTIGILGMAFKGNHDDNRESLSYKLKKILEFYAKSVLCSDPYVVDERLVPVEQVMNECEIIIIASPHSVYKTLQFGEQKVVDLWNLLGNGALI